MKACHIKNSAANGNITIENLFITLRVNHLPHIYTLYSTYPLPHVNDLGASRSFHGKSNILI